MNKIFALLVSAVLMLTTCGCYDNNETDTLATVMAVGIDGKGEEKTYTFAVADTGGISDKSKGDGADVICFSAVCPDVSSAIKAVDAKTSKRLSFSHLSAVLFSTETMSEGVFEDVDYFQKKVSVRPQTLLAITETGPLDYLSDLNLSLEANPERYFENILRKKKFYVPECTVSDFITSYHAHTAAVLPVIPAGSGDKAGKNEITESELVYDGKSVARIEDNWLLGLVLGTKEVRRGFDALQSVRKPQIDVALEADIPVVYVNLVIKSESGIDIAQLRDDIEKKLTDYARNMCDVVDIATLARKNFRRWKDYEKYDWNEMVKKAVFNVKITSIEEEEV